MNLQDLIDLKNEALTEAQSASDAAALEAVRIKYLGRKGLLPKIMEELRSVTPEERPMFGKTANELKNELAEMIKTQQAALAGTGTAAAGFVAACLYGMMRQRVAVNRAEMD